MKTLSDLVRVFIYSTSCRLLEKDNKVTGDALHHLPGRVNLQRKTKLANIRRGADVMKRCFIVMFPGLDECNGKRQTNC